MSGNGRLRAQLEARRREQMRLERVRSQCRSLAHQIKENLRSEQLSSQILQEFEAQLLDKVAKAEATIQEQPDQTLSKLTQIGQEANQFLAEEVVKQRGWEAEQQESLQMVLDTTDAVTSVEFSNKDYATRQSQLLSRLNELRKVKSSKSDVEEVVTSIREEISELNQKQEEEDVRREIARQIIKALRANGFITAKPKLNEQGVHLVGKTPSNKKVTFIIQDQRQISFQFDDFEGTTCKDQLDEVLGKLEQEAGVSTSIEQFTWHNPDRIRKGAKDQPMGPAHQRTMKR